jgi:hypothetical protein
MTIWLQKTVSIKIVSDMRALLFEKLGQLLRKTEVPIPNLVLDRFSD